MNTRQRWTFATVGLIVATSFVLWAATGFNIYTKQQIPIEEVDDLLGVKVIVWKDVFMVGLDIAGTVALAALVIGAIVYVALRTRVPKS